jgi:hypothetical protein
MRKRRTREHIIEDLSFNHVERQVLYAAMFFIATAKMIMDMTVLSRPSMNKVKLRIW